MSRCYELLSFIHTLAHPSFFVSHPSHVFCVLFCLFQLVIDVFIATEILTVVRMKSFFTVWKILIVGKKIVFTISKILTVRMKIVLTVCKIFYRMYENHVDRMQDLDRTYDNHIGRMQDVDRSMLSHAYIFATTSLNLILFFTTGQPYTLNFCRRFNVLIATERSITIQHASPNLPY